MSVVDSVLLDTLHTTYNSVSDKSENKVPPASKHSTMSAYTRQGDKALIRNPSYPHATPHHAMPRGVCLAVTKCNLSCVLVFRFNYSTPCHSTRHDVGRSVCPGFWPTRGVGWKSVAWRGTSRFVAHTPRNAFSNHRSCTSMFLYQYKYSH
jgi:hypothetical protein